MLLSRVWGYTGVMEQKMCTVLVFYSRLTMGITYHLPGAAEQKDVVLGKEGPKPFTLTLNPK